LFANVGSTLLTGLLYGVRIKILMTYTALAELGFPLDAVMS
jgi:hypothetical protein